MGLHERCFHRLFYRFVNKWLKVGVAALQIGVAAFQVGVAALQVGVAALQVGAGIVADTAGDELK